MQDTQIDWETKISESKDNAGLLGILFELLLEEYCEHRVSDEDYLRYRDLICECTPA